MLRDLSRLGRPSSVSCACSHHPVKPHYRAPEPQESDRFAPSFQKPAPEAEPLRTQAPPAAPSAPSRSAPPPAPSPVTLLAEAPATRLADLVGGPAPKGSGLDPGNLDPTIRPQADFYQYATGGWQATHPIPPEQARRGTFSELAERNRAVLKGILEELAARTDLPVGSEEQKIADFYASGMDQAAIDAAGARPLQPLFDRIASLDSLQDLQGTVAEFHRKGLPALFGFGATQDYKDNTRVIAESFQGGLGLPDRDYYLADDEKSVKLRESYEAHVARMFGLLGDDADTAKASAEKVMALETRLARASLTKEETRDPSGLYHLHDRKQLAELTPHFSWEQYFADRGRADLDTVNVATPAFFSALDGMLTEVPLDDWKTYLRWHAINSTASYLSKDLDDANFDFKGRTLTGVTEQQPRWKRISSAVDGALGEALGKKFVEKTFTPESKVRVREMIVNIKAALAEDLDILPWMSDATRRQAQAKLNTFVDKIGFPDEWKDYSDLRIDRGVYVDNVLRANEFAVTQDLAKIGRPVNRGEWGMSPATVNAYYNPLMNEIVFPAAILQPPFFNPDADDAVNYGAIGVVMGHEVTHGFDDSGSQFDEQGNLRNWWTPEDRANFDVRAQRIVDQADAYEVQPGLHLSGKLVVGEALADQGGVELAYAAFQRSLVGKPRTLLDGWNPEQRFFLGFGQVWAQNTRPEYERLQVTTDPHPVSRFRVNNTLANFPPFYEAFDVKPGDPLYRAPEDRGLLWWPEEDKAWRQGH